MLGAEDADAPGFDPPRKGGWRPGTRRAVVFGRKLDPVIGHERGAKTHQFEGEP